MGRRLLPIEAGAETQVEMKEIELLRGRAMLGCYARGSKGRDDVGREAVKLARLPAFKFRRFRYEPVSSMNMQAMMDGYSVNSFKTPPKKLF